MEEEKVWLVKIVMPKKLMNEIQQGSLELESEKLDVEDVETAYEQGQDDATNFDAAEEEQQAGVTDEI